MKKWIIKFIVGGILSIGILAVIVAAWAIWSVASRPNDQKCEDNYEVCKWDLQ